MKCLRCNSQWQAFLLNSLPHCHYLEMSLYFLFVTPFFSPSRPLLSLTPLAPVEVYQFPDWWQVAGLSLGRHQEPKPHHLPKSVWLHPRRGWKLAATDCQEGLGRAGGGGPGKGWALLSVSHARGRESCWGVCVHICARVVETCRRRMKYIGGCWRSQIWCSLGSVLLLVDGKE